MTSGVDIKIENLRFAYNGVEIIRGFDLSVASGAFHSLLGPNGSGKTTLVKLLSGALEASSGTIEIFGEPIRSIGKRKLAKSVAVVPQGSVVAFDFTAFEVVLMGRSPYLGGLSLEGEKDWEIAREAMTMTNTWDLRNRSMNQLSGGEAQRVIVARALAQQPKILLLDEATVFLDIKHQIELMELLRKLNVERGVTVLAVTHDLNLAASYADRVTLMKDGAAKAEGAPKEVLTKEKIFDVFGANVKVLDIDGRPGILPAGVEV